MNPRDLLRGRVTPLPLNTSFGEVPLHRNIFAKRGGGIPPERNSIARGGKGTPPEQSCKRGGAPHGTFSKTDNTMKLKDPRLSLEGP